MKINGKKIKFTIHVKTDKLTWITTEINYNGRCYSVGGGFIHDEETADNENDRLGCNFQACQNWPNSFSAGDFEPVRGSENEAVSGECEALMIAVGYDPENDKDRESFFDDIYDISLRAFKDFQKGEK